MQLRPHQEHAVAAAERSLVQHRSALVVMPTGVGKTIVFSELVRRALDPGKRVLVLTHMEEILEQTVVRLREDVGVRSMIEKAERRASPDAPCVVASVPTLSQPKRLERWATNAFDLIVADEAHHAVAQSWQRIFDHFDAAKILGVTATPDRADCKSLGKVFENVAYEYTIKEAIGDGWLCPIRQRFVRVDGLDYSSVRTVAKDLNQGDLQAVLANDTILRLMAEPTVELVGTRQAIVFTVSVAHAHAFAQVIRGLGRNAVALDGGTSKEVRRETVDRYRVGQIQYLVACGLFLEGFDAPNTSAIVMGRPTLSRALYAQGIGRGLRIADDKRDCIVLDFVGNSGRHSLIHSFHIVDPDADDRVAERAETIAEGDPELSTEDALQMAFEQIGEEDARAALEREAAQQRTLGASYDAVDIDPFEGSEVGKTFRLLGLTRQEDRWGHEISPKQLEALRRFGIKDPDLLSRLEASQLLEQMIGRSQEGRATIKQVRALIRAGTLPENALRMSFEQASRGIVELKENGWRRPPQWGPSRR